MKIVIIANFVILPWEAGNCRFLYLLNHLDCKKNDVELITTDFWHSKKTSREQKKVKLPFKITYIHEPGYKQNICLKRFYSHYIWGKNVNKYLKSMKKPDIVYCSVPSLTGPSLVAKFCEKNNIKFIIDVQDLWPEAFKMIFNPPIIGDLIYLPFKIKANSIYKRADEICAVSDTYASRAFGVNKKCQSYHTVFLGTELKTFDKNVEIEKNVVDFMDKKVKQDDIIIFHDQPLKLIKSKDELWIGYCGTLGSSYDLENAIKAIATLKNVNIRLIVMGNGPLYDKFVELARNEKIKATFTDKIPYSKMCSILCKCDITINPIKHNAAQSIINKHADYVASGLPLISTQENNEFRELVEKYNIGFNCKNDDIMDISNCISKLAKNKKLRETMGKNARKLAEEKFDRFKTYDELVKLILQK